MTEYVNMHAMPAQGESLADAIIDATAKLREAGIKPEAVRLSPEQWDRLRDELGEMLQFRCASQEPHDTFNGLRIDVGGVQGVHFSFSFAEAASRDRARDLPSYPYLPRYRCHKVVEAMKIRDVLAKNHPMIRAFGGGHFVPDGAILYGDEIVVRVDQEYVDKHNPQPGGYYVRYADGYESWSPAEAFEQGYTRIG